MQKLKAHFRRKILQMIDIPSINDFSDQDQKLIDEWLAMSAGHKGFHLYVKARDRAFAQAMLQLPIATESERRAFYELSGARMENVRLLRRAQRQ